ncbi:phosphotransferase [Microlunatus soli]|uniref:Ser/Thr protein kinase RdoA involved in Cpx stress response, MazF antagonist n=1 Tax=Microlunatus soli TaxID=630515 RepID=A0A1H1NX04_9ACTN|nr:phosphotransferase [Microlunatus soli]SDS03477.1 Ser/Thr protein kinase RdoA involved in Cpx stress response, MazF antagonist [Microlunatus soli]
MINSSQQIIDRDPALPGMAVLLADPRVDYLRYKPGTSLTVALRTADGPAFGYAVSEAAAVKLAKIVRKAPAGAVLRHDPERRVVIADPVADRDLPGVAEHRVRQAELLAYKPQRRWIAALDADRIVRSYRSSDLPAAVGRWPRSDAGVPVRIPAVVGRDRRRGLMIIERLRGTRLDRLSGSAALDGWLAAGTALAGWHRSAVGRAVRADFPDPYPTAELLAVLVPGSADRFRRLAGQLAAATHTAETGWCHGDFSADQVLIDRRDHRPAILDWDRSGRRPLGYDLATADAAGTSESAPGLPEPAWQALLTGYTGIRDLPTRLHALRALAWFVRAAEPFRRADPHWPAAILARVDRSEELLG